MKHEIGRSIALESLQQLGGRQDLDPNPVEFEQLGSVRSTKQQSARAEKAEFGDRCWLTVQRGKLTDKNPKLER